MTRSVDLTKTSAMLFEGGFTLLYCLTVLNYAPLFHCGTSSQVRLEVEHAINCGGGTHTDQNGVEYMADYLDVGTASSHGKRYTISRVDDQDQALYQTERYHTSDFSYNIPVSKDGTYVLVLKFSEVYFRSVGLKVFDVQVNDVTVLEDLDIHKKVDFATAHDEYVEINVKNKQAEINNIMSVFDGRLRVKFVKGRADNPKVNAIVLFRGTMDQVPRLPPLSERLYEDADDERTSSDSTIQREEEEEEEEDLEEDEEQWSAQSPRVKDPYAQDSYSGILPVVVCTVVFMGLVALFRRM